MTKTFSINSSRGFRSARLTAVNDVSFDIRRGEVFGLVGESGCGKSTLYKAALRLIEASSGSVYYQGRNLYEMSFRELMKVRREMQVVFQDPYDSLNPRMTLEELAAEPLRIHKYGGRARRLARTEELFAAVGLPVQLIKGYPHQLSGGQRQRLCIARALSLSPEFIVCDEAVSALDVSIQAQILNLLLDLKEQMGLTYLFISHNLSVVRFVSDRIGVMYFGRLVELAGKDELFDHILHPYTYALLSAVPEPDPGWIRKYAVLQGSVPSMLRPQAGCVFHSRCPHGDRLCTQTPPELRDFGGGHYAACHKAGELNLSLDTGCLAEKG
ncbi:MAG: ATP-binding cassette domain-containing protein [Peptococcaceae bacterium]|nr:ATP-binding cassette domain-containing protein [Peptococcaceae bacterium]